MLCKNYKPTEIEIIKWEELINFIHVEKIYKKKVYIVQLLDKKNKNYLLGIHMRRIQICQNNIWLKKKKDFKRCAKNMPFIKMQFFK